MVVKQERQFNNSLVAHIKNNNYVIHTNANFVTSLENWVTMYLLRKMVILTKIVRD